MIDRRRALQALAVGGAATAVVSSPHLPGAVGKELDPAKVPNSVKQAANRVVPGVKWTGADRSKEDEKVVYELDGLDGKGREVSVMVTDDGKVMEVDTEIDLKDVLPAVVGAITAKVPKFKATSVSEVHRGDNLVRSDDGERVYTLEGKEGKGRVGAEVTPEGKIVELDREIGLKQVPKAVTSALTDNMPKFKLTSAAEIYQGDELVGYLLQGQRPQDKDDLAVFATADGKEITVEDGD